jgi:hypothetical protein
VLVIRRLHVTYHLSLDPAHREMALRVHGFHAESCPVYRTLRGCIALSTALEMEDF